MSDVDELIQNLKQARDELRVKIDLASKDVRDDWEGLESKMEDFVAKAGLEETGEGVGKALEQLGQELKLGYERIRDAVQRD